MLERRTRATIAATAAPKLMEGKTKCFRLLIIAVQFPVSTLSNT